MNNTTIETKLAHTVHARDGRRDSRCLLCLTYGPIAVPEDSDWQYDTEGDYRQAGL